MPLRGGSFKACRHNARNTALISSVSAYYPPFASRAKGEVFVLLYVCLFVRQRFLDNPRADSRTNDFT